MKQKLARVKDDMNACLGVERSPSSFDMRRETEVEQRLAGKVAAVTGAASGIGKSCAKALIDEGARVVLVDADETKLRKAQEELGPSASSLTLDLLDREQLATLLPQILEIGGDLHIFHANAGAYVGGDVTKNDLDDWDHVLDLNVRAALRSVGEVIPYLVQQGTGDVILTSSIAGIDAIVWEPVYSASKHAIQAFTHATRKQLAHSGVRVCAVLPGPVITPLIDDWPTAKKEEALAQNALMEASEVAEAVVFMLTRNRGVVIRDLVILPTGADL